MTRRAVPTTDPEDLGEQLLRVARSLRRTWLVDLSEHDLSPHEARALRVACDREEPPRLRELADALRVAPRSVTDVVDALESKGYLSRQPAPGDRRASIVVVTDEGRRVRAAIHAARRRGVADRMGGLSAARRRALADALTALEEELD